MASSELAGSIVDRFQRIKGERSNWESQWEEIAERILPRYKSTILTDLNIVTKGDKRSQKIFDSTGELALERFSSVMDSMLTPRNATWHRLITGNDILDANRQVQLYMEEVNKQLFRFRYAPEANFAGQNSEDYVSLGAFGTGCLFIDELRNARGGLRYKAVPLSTFYILENHQGIVDTAFRRIWYTSRQAVQRWGKDNLPEKIVKAASDNSGSEQQWEFLHCVKPREERDPTRRDSNNMPFASYYISIEGKQLVDEGGFQTFPYAVSRYVTGPGEMYGRSPAMTALPSIKTLNEQKKAILKQGHRVVDPVLLSHDDGVIGTFSMRPGALNPGSMSADGKRLVDVLPTGNLATGLEMQNEERKLINDVFLVNLFQILVDTPQMTATEVLERTREKGILLAPTLGRQQDEKLGPMITREIDLLSQQGLLPPMPDIMKEAGGEFEVRYDSPLSRAQRAEEAAGLFRTMEFANSYSASTGDLSVYDHINVDEAMPDVMAINAVPSKWRSSEEEIAAKREGRAKEAEEVQDIQALPGAAGVLKAVQ